MFQVMMNTTEIMIGSLDHILQICMMYEKSKYVVRKNKSDSYERREIK